MLGPRRRSERRCCRRASCRGKGCRTPRSSRSSNYDPDHKYTPPEREAQSNFAYQEIKEHKKYRPINIQKEVHRGEKKVFHDKEVAKYHMELQKKITIRRDQTKNMDEKAIAKKNLNTVD